MKKRVIIFFVFVSLLFSTNVFSISPGFENKSNAFVSQSLILDLTQKDTTRPLIKPLLGVVSGPGPAYDSQGIDLTEHLKDIGVQSLINQDYYDDRLTIEQILSVPGSETYPSWVGDEAKEEKSYQWDLSDAQFERMIKNFDVVLRIGTEEESLKKEHGFKGPQDAKMEKNWIMAADKMIKRYKNYKGKKKIKQVALWSEFPGEEFWDRSEQSFYAFWEKSLHILKYNHPNLLFGGPGFGQGATKEIIEGNSSSVFGFLNWLYRKKSKPDWIGWHVFSNDPYDVYKAAKAYECLLRGKKPFEKAPWAKSKFFSNTKLMVTSFGLLQDNDDLEEKVVDQLYNKKVGASILTGHWIALQHSAVEGSWLYRANDVEKQSAQKLKGGSGLFWSDRFGTYKPIAHAFRLWSRMVKEFPFKIKTAPFLQDDMSGFRLWVLAGQSKSTANADSKVGILVSNPNSLPITIKTRYLFPRKQAKTFVVDDENNGRTGKIIEKSEIVVPPHTVMLVQSQ